MKSKHQERVEEFMKLAGQEIPDKPTVPNEENRILRAKLILEEALETINRGLGVTIHINDGEHDLGKANLSFYPEKNGFNMEETADGCWDLIVVTTGTLSACGIHDEEGQEEVDNNNLAKFGPGGYRRDDGKWCKPPNHKKPDIKGILERQS